MKSLGRRVAVVAAAIALIATGLLLVRPDPGAHGDEARAAATSTGDGSGRVIVASELSSGHRLPAQLSNPYVYRDAGQEMFVLGPSTASSPGADYPVQVQMNRAAAERAALASGGVVEVMLPDGVRYPVAFERAEAGRGGNWTWIGRVESPLGKLAAVLTYGRDGVFGVLPAPDGKLFQIETSRGQAYLQPDPGLVPAHADPKAPLADVVKPGRGITASAALGILPADTDGSPVTIDVLGVYTTNLVAARGSVAAAQTQFVNLLAVTNQAYIDSGTVARFNLANLVETDYPGYVFNETAIKDLPAWLPDGLDIGAERDAVAADLVVMLRPWVPGDSNCGLGSINNMGFSPDFGFSVVSCGGYSMAHQIGHNLGSQHDWESEAADGDIYYGMFGFSFGHRQTAPASFATIMAVPLPGQPTLGYFSSPGNMRCAGVACGIDDEADNVRSINLMAETISRYRDPPNTVSVIGGKAIEPVYGQEELRFLVRLSSPAPSGGVSFNIATVDGGTATTGADFAEFSQDHVIPEGQVAAWFSIPVLPDDLEEEDEFLRVRLSNVQGMTVFDAEGIGVILDDDPRVTVSGSFLSAGEPVDPSPWLATLEASFQGAPVQAEVVLDGSNYRFTVPKGTRARLRLKFADESPWFDVSEDLGMVKADIVRNISVERAAVVTGRIVWPDGATPPSTVFIELVESFTDTNLKAELVSWSTNYSYVFKVGRGLSVALRTLDDLAPYAAQRVEFFTEGTTVQDIVVSTLPSLTIAHQQVKEAASGASREVEVQVRLSTFAPSGGATFDLVTVDDTAKAPLDYVARKITLTIPQERDSISTTVEVRGDDQVEPEEQFRIVATNIRGARMPGPGVIRILDRGPESPVRDFDGDGQSELVWHHRISGQGALWGGAQYSRALNLASVRDVDWQIMGTGDFDRDGKSDLLWRHRGSGRNAIWRSGESGTQLSMAPLSDTDWEVAGVGDFDGDLQSDVLWHHRVAGTNMIWRGGDSRSTVPVTRITDEDWAIAGTGDFNGDGNADILWRHARTGGNVVWLSGDFSRQQKVVGVTDQRWRVAGAGDFDGDGTDDMLWTHESTGASVVWYGGDRNNQKSLVRITDLHWRIVAVADYNGDGVADIAWRNGATGRNAIWLGGEYKNQQPVVGVRDIDWRIVQ